MGPIVGVRGMVMCLPIASWSGKNLAWKSLSGTGADSRENPSHWTGYIHEHKRQLLERPHQDIIVRELGAECGT